jgi:cytochrome d ubiquinol oxidase subunit I
MELDVLSLSRVQFALTIMFHYLFPPLSIGLGLLLVLFEGLHLRTKDADYHRAARFWTRIFAANFAMGVATGIVMEFQFGTNWANYSRYVGDIFGSALAAEGIFAFFLESGFLALLVFGWDKVSPPVHFFATVMVSLGSIFSAVWIIVANSWQQTPAGFHVVAQEIAGKIVERVEVTDFWTMVLNPSSLVRLGHVLLGAFILGAFVVLSVSAWYLLRNRHVELARKTFKVALVVGTVTALLQLASGHVSAMTVAQQQPAKLAALEAHFETGPGNLYIFGWPDPEKREVNFGVYIPGGLSLLVHGDPTAPVLGRDKFRPEDSPPVRLPFLAFHLMVGMGMFLIGLSVLACFFWWRGSLFTQRWLLWVFVFAVIAPYVANQAGWVSAEVGRQPFIVYPEMRPGPDGVFVAHGGLRTSEGLSNTKVVTGEHVVASIVLFSLVYLFLLAVYIYILNSKIQHGPDEAPPTTPTTTTGGLLEAASRRGAADPTYSLTGTEEKPSRSA